MQLPGWVGSETAAADDAPRADGNVNGRIGAVGRVAHLICAVQEGDAGKIRIRTWVRGSIRWRCTLESNTNRKTEGGLCKLPLYTF